MPAEGAEGERFSSTQQGSGCYPDLCQREHKLLLGAPNK